MTDIDKALISEKLAQVNIIIILIIRILIVEKYVDFQFIIGIIK